MASTALILISLLYISTLSTATDSPPSPSPLAGGCSDQVVAFSPCLQYISLPPNNRTAAPSSDCCNEFYAAVGNSTAACLCYLVRQPLFLGFPLSTARIFSLSSLCSLPGGGSAANISLELFCSGSSTLPPLQAIIGPETRTTSPRPPRSPPRSMPPPPQSKPNPPHADDEQDSPSAPHPTVHIQSAAEKINSRFRVSFGLMISLLVPISALQIDTSLYIHFVNQVALGLTRIKRRGNE